MHSIQRGWVFEPCAGWVQSILFLVLFLVWMSGDLQAGVKTPELEAALQALGADDEIRVIVKFSRHADLESVRHLPRPQRRHQMIRDMQSLAEQRQAEVKSLLGQRGVKDVNTLWVANAMAIKARPELIQEIAGHPDVQSVQLDRPIHKDEILSQAFASPEPNITQVGAPNVWVAGGSFGQGAIVGLMDTGADVNHPDLAGRWRGGANSWFDPYGGNLQLPFDNDGHGTAVLGVMVGGDAGGTTIGTAPAAKWIAARIFDDAGFTFLSALHQVFQWWLDPDANPATDDSPDVVNGSWGFEALPGVCEDEFQPDIDALSAAGIAAVFAAGNVGPGTGTSIGPANNTGAIAVGAVGGSNTIWTQVDINNQLIGSSRGPSACDGRIYPDLVAPGEGIRSTDLSFGGAPAYTFSTGTSLSAPHASGVLALLVSSFPDATLDQLKATLIAAAVDLPAGAADGPDNTYGNGLINAPAAFNSLQGSGLVPCIRPDIDFSAVPYPSAAGQPVTFTGAVSGGTPPYTYAWDFEGDGVTDCTEAVCTQTYPVAFSGTVGLTVSDASGCSSTLFIMNGWAACTPIAVSFTLSPAAPVAGRPVTFTSSVTGGTAPYTYEWDLDADGTVDCTTATCTQTYSAAFNGNVALSVEDRWGCVATPYSSPVSVTAASSSGGGGGGCFITASAPECMLSPGPYPFRQ
jgi:PKD repeat protein